MGVLKAAIMCRRNTSIPAKSLMTLNIVSLEHLEFIWEMIISSHLICFCLFFADIEFKLGNDSCGKVQVVNFRVPPNSPIHKNQTLLLRVGSRCNGNFLGDFGKTFCLTSGDFDFGHIHSRENSMVTVALNEKTFLHSGPCHYVHCSSVHSPK